jgi:hypothetical protein
MKKGNDYAALKKAGLPVPIYGVFDSSCLCDETSKAKLRHCVEQILTAGSGFIGVRTEPKEGQSNLGNYPHYMPLGDFEEVTDAIKRNEREWPQNQWWYLVNEAFSNYEWNAVVKLTQQGSLPGYWSLEGEVNLTDNLPLRDALANSANLISCNKWIGNDSANLRKSVLQSGLFDSWLEVSKVRTPKGSRLVFWGMRGNDQGKRN